MVEEEEEGTGYRSVLGDLGSPGRFSWLLIHLAKSGLTTDLLFLAGSLPFPLLLRDLETVHGYAGIASTSFFSKGLRETWSGTCPAASDAHGSPNLSEFGIRQLTKSICRTIDSWFPTLELASTLLDSIVV